MSNLYPGQRRPMPAVQDKITVAKAVKIILASKKEGNPERDALRVAAEALATLAAHPAFEDDAPEFNVGGVGYEALKTIRAVIMGF